MSAHDCLQRQLHREVEVIRKQWLNGFDYLAAVRLEGVGRVVVGMTKQNPDAEIDDSVEDELYARVVTHLGTTDEPRSEGAVVSGVERTLVRNDVGRTVRTVGHHDGDGITLESIESRSDGEPE